MAKTRQTKLTFQQPQRVSTPRPELPPPRGGGRLEELPIPKSGFLGVVVTSPKNYRSDVYLNTSPIQSMASFTVLS